MKSKLFFFLCIFTTAALGLRPSLAVAGDEMPKGLKLGLDTAKAIAEQKDVSEGLKAVAKDELSNWMWDSVGGYEKIVFQNSEADIPGVREKAKKIYEAIENVDKAATAVAEGNYADALISSGDVAVGAADHPLVSATWAAVKLTYESHKLVKSSQAELEIETLYGLVNNDRRLLGKTDPKSDAPPEIQLTNETADYFFDKYILTNDSTRQLMKSYVRKELGEDWPEQSWGDYARSWLTIGSGVDTARSAEVEALAAEWRQKGRTWTTRLLKDVNQQAKVAWGETRVRQQLAEFRIFYDRSKIFYNNDIEQMLKEFLAIKQYQRSIPLYKQTLEESKKQRPLLEDAAAKFTSKQFKSVSGWLNTAEEWQLKLLSAGSGAQMVREQSLAATLYQERNLWLALSDKFNGLVKQEEPRIVESVNKEAGPAVPDTGWRWAGAVNAKSEQYYGLFSGTLKPFDFSAVSVSAVVPGEKGAKSFGGAPEQIKAAVLDALNSGNFGLARALIDEWPIAVAKAVEEHFEPYREAVKKNAPPAELVAQTALVEKMTVQIMAALAPIQEQISRIYPLYATLPLMPYDSPGRRALNAQIQALEDQGAAIAAPLSEPSNQLFFMQTAWPRVNSRVVEAYERLNCAPAITVAETLQAMNEAYDAFDQLRLTSVKQQAEYLPMMDAAEKDLPFTAIESPEKTKEWLPILDNSVIVSHVRFALQELNSNLHTFVPKITNSGDSLTAFPGILTAMAAKISERIFPVPVLDTYTTEAANASAVWEAAAMRWLAVPPLANSDILNIRVLVDPSFDPAKRIARLTTVAGRVPGLVSELKADLEKLALIAGTDGLNREKDASWLTQKAKEVSAFYNDQMNKGYLELGTNDYQAAFSPYRYQNMIVVEEPFRHYMTSVELQARAAAMRADWAKSPAYQFIGQYAPQHALKLESILAFPGIKAAADENFIIPGGTEPIYRKSISEAGKFLKSIKPDDTDYEKEMDQLALLLPETLAVPTANELENVKKQALNLGMSEEGYIKNVMGGKRPQAVYQLRENVEGRETFFTHPLAQEYLSVRNEIKTLVNARQDHTIEENQRADRERSAAESLKAMEESGKQQEVRARESLRTTSPADFYGWKAMNVRLNSYSVDGAAGEILIEQDKLVDGELSITARMNHIDGIKTMLISEDGGRTWKPLALNMSIEYVVTPVPDRLYNPMLQIITQEGLRTNLKLIPGALGFRYKAADRTNEIVAAVQELSNAYERQDVGAFSDLIARDYLGNKTTLEEGVRFDFDLFLDIQLKIYINRIQQGAGRYTAEIKWDKSQTPRKTGQVQRTNGRTTITFALEDGRLKVQNLRGDLIYATLSPDIAQASGITAAKIDDIRTAQEARNPVQPGAGTTDDAGGVTSNSLLPVHNSPLLVVPSYPGIGFDFTANAQATANTAASDLDFENSLIFGVQFQKITGTTFDGLATAPVSGYGPGGLSNDGAGAVYAFVTRENYYGKLEILSFDGVNLQFKFVIQTDGTTNIATR